MPAVVKILAVFAGVLALTRFRLHLGAALVVGGIALNALAGLPVSRIAANFAKSLRNPELWIFVGIIALIVEIGRYLTEKENSDAVLSAVRRWGGRNGRVATIMALPAVIGLIPMPAGALVSAPFVQQAGGDAQELSQWKAAVNYWFRHVWEYWWPLYPGVIVALSVFEMDFRKFFAAEAFYTVIALAVGYAVLVRPHVRRLTAEASSDPPVTLRAWLVLLPVAIVVACLFALPPLMETLLPGVEKKIRDMLVLLAGLACAVAYVAAVEILRSGTLCTASGPGAPARRLRLFSTQLKPASINTQISLFGVLVFKFFLAESGLLPAAARELAQSGLPAWLAAAALPWLAGFVTGIAMGFTGTSFPMVVGLMNAPGSGLTPMATLVLAYGWGYIGMMLSPVHLCLLTTRDYFSCAGGGIIRAILVPLAAIAAWSVAAHLIFRAFGA